MSFFTSFCDLPQKEQLRLPLPPPRSISSRFRSISYRYRTRTAAALLVPFAIRDVLLVGDDVVDEAVFLGLHGSHEVVALGVVADAIEGLAGVLGEQLVQLVAR